MVKSDVQFQDEVQQQVIKIEAEYTKNYIADEEIDDITF